MFIITSNNKTSAPAVKQLMTGHSGQFKVQGSRFFIIRHIHNHTSIISSEMQVELKKNTAFT